MDGKVESRTASARVLSWIVGILVLIFIIGLAWLIVAGGVTPALLLWGDGLMIAIPAVGFILIVIAAAMGRY